MKITSDTITNAAGVRLRAPVGRTRHVDLPYAVHASIDETDDAYAIETLDAAHWGERFDRAAAERLVAWVRAELANAAA